MRSSPVHRNDVMYFIHQRQSALVKTPLTERMLFGVPISDPLPCSAIFAMHIFRTGIPVVLPVDCFPVLFTIRAIRQLGAAGKATRLFRFPRHFHFLIFYLLW